MLLFRKISNNFGKHKEKMDFLKSEPTLEGVQRSNVLNISQNVIYLKIFGILLKTFFPDIIIFKKINLLKGEKKNKIKIKKIKKKKRKKRKMKNRNIRQNKKKKMVQGNLGALCEFASILE